MVDLTKLTPAERSAAMRGGTALWGQVGSVHDVRYALPLTPQCRRRKCGCGCGQRVTHRGLANGVCLTMGCELAIRRWIKTGSLK